MFLSELTKEPQRVHILTPHLPMVNLGQVDQRRANLMVVAVATGKKRSIQSTFR